VKQKEVEMLVQLREFARKEFDKIEGKGNPLATCLALAQAKTLSTVVKSLDEVLRGHVTFSSEHLSKM
jgi:hypothetical protein